MKKARLHYWEVQELLLKILGLNELDEDGEEWDYDELTDEHFECEFDVFQKIVEVLLPLTPVLKSELTKEFFHAFVERTGGYVCSIVQTPYVAPVEPKKEEKTDDK